MYKAEVPVAIIGAGPYGLSIAAHLRALRIPFRIFGEPMQSWREHMPRGMSLKSEGFASSLADPEDAFTLRKYCEGAGLPYKDVGYPVPLECFVAYGLEFQRRLVPDLERHEIKRLTRQPGGFALVTSTGEEFGARRVVVATGISHFGHVPASSRAIRPSSYPQLRAFAARALSRTSSRRTGSGVVGGRSRRAVA